MSFQTGLAIGATIGLLAGGATGYAIGYRAARLEERRKARAALCSVLAFWTASTDYVTTPESERN